MDISHQFKEIFVLIAHDRLITVLEKVTAPIVATIESYCIAREESAHEKCQFHFSRAQQQMKMSG